MPPVLVAAGVAAAGSIGAAAIGSKAAKKNAQVASDSTASQIAAAERNRDYQYNLNAPSINRGNAADDRIASLLNLGGNQAQADAAFNSFRDSTGYRARLGEGLSAVNNGAFAGGAGQSGATLRRLQEVGQDYASREFGNYMGYLGGVSATGAGARGLVAGVGNNSTNQLINAFQTGSQQQIGANNQLAANGQNLIGNLVNAGLYAYGSSYKGAGW